MEKNSLKVAKNYKMFNSTSKWLLIKRQVYSILPYLLYISVCANYLISPELLRQVANTMLIHPQNTQHASPENKGILLHNYNTINKHRRINNIHKG